MQASMLYLWPNFGCNPSKHVEVRAKPFVKTNNYRQQQTTNSGQSDPYVYFLLWQAIQRKQILTWQSWERPPYEIIEYAFKQSKNCQLLFGTQRHILPQQQSFPYPVGKIKAAPKNELHRQDTLPQTASQTFPLDSVVVALCPPIHSIHDLQVLASVCPFLVIHSTLPWVFAPVEPKKSLNSQLQTTPTCSYFAWLIFIPHLYQTILLYPWSNLQNVHKPSHIPQRRGLFLEKKNWNLNYILSLMAHNWQNWKEYATAMKFIFIIAVGLKTFNYT